MPGARVWNGGLDITNTGLAIVEQDGSGGQSNSPVNLYGTHLAFSGQITLNAKITDLHGDAALQLYGRPPIIQDEFRVESPSVRLTVHGKKLTVRVWDGRFTRDVADQKPVLTKAFTFAPASDTRLELTHKNGKLTVVANSKTLGTVAEHGAFVSNKIWFGADASNKWHLAALNVEPAKGATARAVDTSVAKISTVSSGLQQLVAKKRPGFLLGSAMALAPAVSDAKYARLAFGGNFGLMTVENALKFQFVQPKPGVYTYQEADGLVNLARSHGLQVHGHALVFGEANPRWVQELPTATVADRAHVSDVMTDHITRTVKHFKGRVASWDVVNEPLADYDDTPDGEGATLRTHIWERALGPNYIALAFRTAHAADPHAKLFLNDYGLESDGDRWDALIRLVTQLKNDHVPIDGVGFESHVYEAEDRIDTSVLRQHIQQLAALGLQSRVSEMDVYSDDGQSVQAEQYADVLAACKSEPSCVSFTTWGFDDDYDMWQDDNNSLQHGKDLLWTTGAVPTPAVMKMQQVLQE